MLTRWKVTAAAFDAATRLLGLQLRGDGDEGDDDQSAPADDAVFYQQLGVAVRPVVARTLRALGFEDGDEVIALKLWDKAAGPTDLSAGETRLYACGDLTARVRVKTDGLTVEARGATIAITSAGAIQVTPAAGQDIVLNGGSAKVARVGDATAGHTHAAGSLQVVIPSGPAAGTYAVTGASGSATDTIAAGAANVKA